MNGSLLLGTTERLWQSIRRLERYNLTYIL